MKKFKYLIFDFMHLPGVYEMGKNKIYYLGKDKVTKLD